MWNPKNIEIENLFAHKNSKYEFKNDSCVVIFGKNNCDKGLENNGAGKTTLFEAICISLTGDSLRNIKKDNFINRDSKSCKIVFELENKVLKMDLKIIRQFSRSGSSKVEIWENGELNNQITSVNEANKRITELIGISREDLLRYYIISQDSQYTFFTASDADKKEIMNRITSADMIQSILDEISESKKNIESKLRVIESKLNEKLAVVDVLNSQKDEIMNNDKCQDEIDDITNKIIECDNKMDEINSNINRLKLDKGRDSVRLKEIKLVNVDSLRKKRNSIRLKISDLENEINENISVQKKLKSELNDTIECPKCGHEFIYESELNLSVDDAKKLLNEVEGSIEACNKKRKSLKDEFDSVDVEMNEAIRNQELQETINRNIKRIDFKLSDCENEINSIKKRKNSLEFNLEALKNGSKYDNILKSIDDKLKNVEVEINDIEESKKPLQDELDVVNFWNIKMGRLGFTTYLANKSIKVIEGITNNFLRRFGVDISVQINGFTILKSGEVREKIDVFVTHDGVTMESFMAKSGGERGRVTLAGVLGIQHLINLSLNGKGLNLLCFDECFHGMDSRGQENIIKIFEKLGITTMVITQNVSEGFNNENTLYVVKDNDISRYV
jgi:DNA repair exonuclease SbcCD ATPase subunit